MNKKDLPRLDDSCVYVIVDDEIIMSRNLITASARYNKEFKNNPDRHLAVIKDNHVYYATYDATKFFQNVLE